jgi:hypothetical protein
VVVVVVVLVEVLLVVVVVVGTGANVVVVVVVGATVVVVVVVVGVIVVVVVVEPGHPINPVAEIAYKVPPGFVVTDPVTTHVFPGEVTLSLIANVPNGYSSEYSIELSSQFVI